MSCQQCFVILWCIGIFCNSIEPLELSLPIFPNHRITTAVSSCFDTSIICIICTVLFDQNQLKVERNLHYEEVDHCPRIGLQKQVKSVDSSTALYFTNSRDIVSS